jgi:formate dehydrogenase iron-sulfur subunit
MVEYGLLIDTSLCIACRACQVSCKQWNEREAEATTNVGTYQNPQDLSWQTWTYVRFSEVEDTAGNVEWLFRRELCRHCETPGCLAACPVPDAIVKDQGGMVVVNRNLCGDCLRECRDGCPWDVPRFYVNSAGVMQNEMWKCWMCRDRVFAGGTTACSKTCPVGATLTLEKSTLLNRAYSRLAEIQPRHPHANIYPPTGYGTNVVWILVEDPSSYAFSFPSTVSRGQGKPSPTESLLPRASTTALAATALTAGIAAAARFLRRREKMDL